MKKLLIASTIALAATAASALDFGVVTSRNLTGTERNAAGVTVGQSFGPVSLTAGAERTTVGSNDQNRFSLVAGYDVTKVGSVVLTAKAGGVYLNNQTGADGYAAVVGAGATLPVTKTVAATVDFTRQYGQNRVESSDGNRVTAGLKYSF